MKTLLALTSLTILGTLAYGQCVPPTVTTTGLPANWPLSPNYTPTRPVDPPSYFSCANYANSPLPLRTCSLPDKDGNPVACYGNLECQAITDAQGNSAVCSGTPVPGTGMRKFVDGLPG
jgi:hypothetical protein